MCEALRYQLKLDTPKKGDPDKKTVREALYLVFVATGVMPPELKGEPPIMTVGAYILEWFWELCETRQLMSAGMGAALGPISYTEILSWATLRKLNLPVWVVSVIRALDRTYLSERNKDTPS